MDFLTEALGGSANSGTGGLVKNGAEAAKGTGSSFDLSNLLSQNANLGGLGGPFAKGGSLQMLGDVPISSGQQQMRRPPQDDFLMGLYM